MTSRSLVSVFSLGAMLGLSAAVTSSCGTPATTCNAQTCANGCCANGQCVGGATNAQCGARGLACVACPIGFSCMTGSCVQTNMAGGFATGGGTAGGSTAGGSTAGGSTAGGSTAGGSTAGGSTAGGSTAGGSTAGGSTAGGSTAGGTAGGVVACSSANCAGCCNSSGVCVAGTSLAECGSQGNSCIGCAGAQVCSAGSCQIPTAGGSAAGGSAAGGTAGGARAGGTAGGSTAGGTGGGPSNVTFAVLRVGDGGVALSSAGAHVIIEQRVVADGTLIGALDVSANTPSPGFSIAGSSTFEGNLTLSGNGAFAVIAGYRAAPGTASVNTANGLDRVVIRINSAGTIDANTIINDAHAGSLRAAATNDGTGYWTVGAASGVRYVVHNSTGMSADVYSSVANNRFVGVFSGQLFVSTGGTTGLPTDAGTATQLYSLGALPQAAGSYTSLPGVDISGQAPNGFVLLDQNAVVAGVDVLYVADTAGSSAGGVRKYVFNGLVWTLAWRANSFTGPGSPTTTTAGCQFVTVIPTVDNIVLCVDTGSSANRIIKYVDVGGASPTAPTGTVLVTAPANTGYRGIAPVPQ